MKPDNLKSRIADLDKKLKMREDEKAKRKAKSDADIERTKYLLKRMQQASEFLFAVAVVGVIALILWLVGVF